MLASERSARRVIKQNATQKRVMDRLEYKDAVRGEYGRRPVFQRSLHNQQVRAGFGNQVRTMMQRFKKRLFKKQGSRGNHAYGYGTSSLLPPSVYKDLRSTHRVARVNLYCLSWVMAFGCCCFTPLICLSSYCVLTVREKVGSLELIKTKAYVVMMISVLSLLAMLCAGLPISIIVFVAAGDGYDNKSFVSAWVSDSLSECTPFTYDKDQRGKPPEFDDDGVITNGGDPNNCHYTRKCCAQERTEVSCYQQSKDRAVCLRSAVTSIDNKRHHELSLPSYQKNIKARAGLLLDASIKYVTQAQFDSDGGLTEVSRGHCFRTLEDTSHQPCDFVSYTPMASTDTFANLDDRETQKDLATVFFVIAFLAGSVATAILLHQSWNLIKLYRFLARYQAAANAEYAGVLPWWLSEQKTDDPGYIYAIDAYDNPDAAAQVRPQDYGYYNQREAELQQWEENHVWGVDRQADLDIITQKAMRDGLKRPDDELHLRINAQEDRFKAQGDAAYVEATLADSENYPSNFLQAAAPGAQPKGQGKKGKGGKKAGKKMGRMK